MNQVFLGANILLPDFNTTNGTKWAALACDQYTSEPEYWEEAKKIVGDAPSTLNITLQEVYLSETEERIPKINGKMKEYLGGVLLDNPDSIIYLERKQSDGRIRHGIIGMVDLEAYDYKKGSSSMIRATEGTVLSRIPPRVKIRRDAVLETPHVLLLIDDPERTVIEPLYENKKNLQKAYDFDLMLKGGHVSGYFADKNEKNRIFAALDSLASTENMKSRYGKDGLAPLLFAVGDGNHSLATAKACYEELKEKIGAEAAFTHPSRYALCEVVNLHDEALSFEPIYRVVFGADPHALMDEFKKYAKALSGEGNPQKVTAVIGDACEDIAIPHPEAQLTVGTLQAFLDEYVKLHPDAEVDYIHGVESLRTLAKKENAIGFLFDGMEKDELFKTVIFDGALPRKTFSMGHADDKRYYLECRKIAE